MLSDYLNNQKLKKFLSVALASLFFLLSIFTSTGSALADDCQKAINLTDVRVLEGQGIGEGRLDLEVNARLLGQPDTTTSTGTSTGRFQLGVNKSKSFNIRMETLPDPGITYILETDVREREVGRDQFTGATDTGSESTNIEPGCPNKKIEEDVKISGANKGKVRVTYYVTSKPINGSQTGELNYSPPNLIFPRF
jgi:hypothetical protein